MESEVVRKLKDQKRINENKKTLLEEKKKNDEGGSSSGTGTYQRKKWGGKPSEENTPVMGMSMVKGIWKMTCKHGCGLNSTHTSGCHNKWEVNPSGFKLSATHPWWRKVGQQHLSGVNFTSDTSASTIGSQSAQTADALVLSRSKTKKALEEASRKTESVEVAAALEAFAKVLNLKQWGQVLLPRTVCP